ncbi:phage portal protein [Prosthecochloris sp. ZM]|uniref:phage portal protein n=1 Tax=Prosthecochloris sp. ZM TaxID=2283143 RepID=UPI000DF84517|nr:phage portal protein [Prosthecochloris sp. ZM]RDD29908.1 phage portal protein [Prosthecochloris sp. ZM]
MSELLQNGRLLDMMQSKAGVRSARSSSLMTGGRVPSMGKKARRQFTAASSSRLWSDWPSVNLSHDEVIGRDLRALRGRSRWLASNNGYYIRYLLINVQNIVGPRGVKLDAKVKFGGGQFDKASNAAIENSWKRWGKKGIPMRRSGWTRQDMERAIIFNVVRDGEVFIRKWFGKGEFGFQLELIDPMRVSTDLNKPLSRGSEIINGIEYRDGEVQAYWINKQGMRSDYEGREAVRVPAKYIEHLYFPLEAEQKRGVPWMASGMQRVHMLDKYEHAEVTQARIAAEKGGFFTKTGAEAEGFDGEPGAEDDEIEYLDSDAGSFATLPEGYDFKQFDPTHPTTAFDPFSTKLLRGIASAGNINYNSLANDLSDVNYSSARIGLLEVRDNWQEKQQWLIGWFHEPIFPDWLRMAMTTGRLNLSFARYDEYVQAVTWVPRSWAWVDPQKEAIGNRETVGLRAKSLSEVAAERGVEFEEVIDSLAKEREYAEKAGIDMSAIFSKKTGESSGDDALRSLLLRIEALESALDERMMVTPGVNGHKYAEYGN